MSATPEQLTRDLWRWTARHPEWHPGEFGKEVACFALRAHGEAILIDPLLPEDPAPVLDLVDDLVDGPLSILISIPYHVRSSEEIARRHPGTTIWGHAAAAKRLTDRGPFREIHPGNSPLPAGITAHQIGKPKRYEMPFHVPSHDALVFGDAVAEVDGELVVWSADKVDAKVERFYRERFNPTVEPLLELDFDRVLVTHGEPVMSGGRDKLRKALTSSPWYHHG